jgi:hypothetical protein
MTKVLALAGAAVSALILTTSFGQAELNYEAAKKLNLMKIVGCAVSGSPVEFPDDVKIINKGFGPLVAGTKVKWSVPSAGKQGVYTLTAGLASGKAVLLSGVLPGGVEAGNACSAKFV